MIGRLNDRCRSPASVIRGQVRRRQSRAHLGTRTALRARFPDCAELVWDNYNFFVIGYSPTERPSDYIVSIAASAAGVSLSFNGGADLDDPDGVLLGSSKINRFIRISSTTIFNDPRVSNVINTAAEASKVPRPWMDGGQVIIRSISAKQRPRRRSG